MPASPLRRMQEELLILLAREQEAVRKGEAPDFVTATSFDGVTLILPSGRNVPLNRQDLDELLDRGLARITRYQRHGDISGTITNDGLDLADRLERQQTAGSHSQATTAERVDDLILAKPEGEPVAFISYSHDSDDHKEWVRTQLAERLMATGIRVILDQWHLKFGSDLAVFMESLSRADYVLIVCTPMYAQRANNRQGGVGYESSIITGEILSERPSIEPKFVPLLRAGTLDEARPAFLRAALAADLRPDNKDYEKEFWRLLRQLHREPEHMPPPIGMKPNFETDARLDG